MKTAVGNSDQRKDVDNDEEHDGMRETCCFCWTGKHRRVLIFYQGVAQGCALAPDIFKKYINDLIAGDEAATPRGTVRGDTVSGFMFADGFVGISGTPEGLQKESDKALYY